MTSLNGRAVVIAYYRLVVVLPRWLSLFNVENIELSIAIELERPSLVPVDYIV
ncbi:MAG: hypothetical protein F7C07_00410 [Desulfurococcales archaeon]|nr:hypothetical protein [Desulfurococcales archaeon]